jgi:hypothetical protein
MFRQKYAVLALSILLLVGLIGGCTEDLDASRDINHPTTSRIAPAPTPTYTPPARTDNTSQTGTVYIAPYSGEKWHVTPNCRGLSNARSVAPLSFREAQQRGYAPCKICAR